MLKCHSNSSYSDRWKFVLNHLLSRDTYQTYKQAAVSSCGTHHLKIILRHTPPPPHTHTLTHSHTHTHMHAHKHTHTHMHTHTHKHPHIHKHTHTHTHTHAHKHLYALPLSSSCSRQCCSWRSFSNKSACWASTEVTVSRISACFSMTSGSPSFKSSLFSVSQYLKSSLRQKIIQKQWY